VLTGRRKPFRVAAGFGDVQSLVIDHLRATRPERTPARVLDAGAGRRLPFPLPYPAHVVGLDVSEAGLAENDDLDERIVGDVETYPLPADEFDLVVCWNVLEHVRRPLAAVRNLAIALRPGGLLVVGVPNLTAPKTIVTKLTPHAFHVWVYRSVLGNPRAGLPGHAPFPTHLRTALLPARFRRALRRLGLSVQAELRYPSGMVPAVVDRRPTFRRLWRMAEAPWRLAGADPSLSDIVWIVRKPAAGSVLPDDES